MLAEKRLSILLTVPGSSAPKAYQIPVDYKEMAGRINSLAVGLKSSKTSLENYRNLPGIHDHARYLYDLLIKPIEKDLKDANAGTLMLSLTDVLRFVPFAVLRNEQTKRYLIQDYELALYNEAAIVDSDLAQLTKPPKTQWRVAGLGLSEAVEDMQPLTEVPGELKAVTTSQPGGKDWLNKDFTLAQMRSAMSGPYDVLHVASHFKLDVGYTPNSKLYLGDKSTLTLQQIQSEAMNFSGIDLVTLSACETGASGGKASHGQEMESLAATVQRRKAAAVLATLWKVADASTASLMTRFYQGRAQGVTKAGALRAAQLNFIEGKAGSRGEWAHPYYWAPFILMGNWR